MSGQTAARMLGWAYELDPEIIGNFEKILETKRIIVTTYSGDTFGQKTKKIITDLPTLIEYLKSIKGAQIGIYAEFPKGDK